MSDDLLSKAIENAAYWQNRAETAESRLDEREKELEFMTADRNNERNMRINADAIRSRAVKNLAEAESRLDSAEQELRTCYARFREAREAWDVIFDPPPAQTDAARIAGHQKLIDALSGVKLVQPNDEDMEWARAAIQELAVERQCGFEGCKAQATQGGTRCDDHKPRWMVMVREGQEKNS